MLKAYMERETAAELKIKTVSTVVCSLPEQPMDVYPVESVVKGPKLCNSDILCHLEQKLGHLPDNEQE